MEAAAISRPTNEQVGWGCSTFSYVAWSNPWIILHFTRLLMYNWLKRKCDHRTIAEMSIWYTITAVVTFMVIILLWGMFTGIANGEDEYDAGGSYMVALLVTLFL